MGRTPPVKTGILPPPASSMAPYPSFSPKGKKLGHCASPPFPTEPSSAAVSSFAALRMRHTPCGYFVGLRRGPQLGEQILRLSYFFFILSSFFFPPASPVRGGGKISDFAGGVHSLTNHYKTGASVSASSGSSLFFGYPYFFSKSRPRYRNVTACARVHFPIGSKIAALLPLVMPFSTAHSTA